MKTRTFTRHDFAALLFTLLLLFTTIARAVDPVQEGQKVLNGNGQEQYLLAQMLGTAAVGAGIPTLAEQEVALQNLGVYTSVPYVTPTAQAGAVFVYANDFRSTFYSVTIPFGAFSAAAKTADVTLLTLPAKAKITAVYMDVTTAFTGGGETAATLSIGVTAGGTTIMGAHSSFTAATWGLADADMGSGMTRAGSIQGGLLPSWTGTTAVTSRLTTTTNNTSTLTAGSVTYTFEISAY